MNIFPQFHCPKDGGKVEHHVNGIYYCQNIGCYYNTNAIPTYKLAQTIKH